MRDASCEEGRTTWGRDRSRQVFGKTFFLAKHELIQLSHLFVGRHVYYAHAALAALEKEAAAVVLAAVVGAQQRAGGVWTESCCELLVHAA